MEASVERRWSGRLQENEDYVEEARAMRIELHDLQWKNRGLVEAEGESRAALKDARNIEVVR